LPYSQTYDTFAYETIRDFHRNGRHFPNVTLCIGAIFYDKAWVVVHPAFCSGIVMVTLWKIIRRIGNEIGVENQVRNEEYPVEVLTNKV